MPRPPSAYTGFIAGGLRSHASSAATLSSSPHLVDVDLAVAVQVGPEVEHGAGEHAAAHEVGEVGRGTGHEGGAFDARLLARRLVAALTGDQVALRAGGAEELHALLRQLAVGTSAPSSCRASQSS